ncbi:RHS repeat-associated core domain-containing protein [Pedobacter zeae]|uniref:RHS repeat-associated protein n=1 Tax=Pedobacter zeae TaxID=1737356 RepID=A0A7W6KCI1_9SPHI|nr:RHS repeat-associated core domain-containing protein [Pedobacter zeae]MBB4109293.1 RHS repeat-associated protein [Pedobacter zeae]GGH11491.1 type IV secretion protein Rhs [Pedobacter zeae]
MKKVKAIKPNMATDRSISLSGSLTKAEPKAVGSGGGVATGSNPPAAKSSLKLLKAQKPAMANTAVQHVSKHFDVVLAIDFHWTTIPIPPSFGFIPLPLPHPFIGMVFDPMDYLRFTIPVPKFAQGLIGAASIPMGGSIFVQGRHKATTTTSVMGVLLPFRHITSLPVYFIVNIPGSPHEGEVYWGSTTVKGQGAEMSGSNPGQVLTCWCPPMGLKPLPTVPGKLKKNPLAYFAFYSDLLSMYVQINTGKPVLVGGTFAPHNYTLKEYLMRFAAIGIMRGLTKLGSALSKAALRGVNKVLRGLFKNNPISKKLCHWGLEPVNFVTGAMFFEWTDFELPGGQTLAWSNVWRSDKPYAGMLGNQVYNNYDLYIYPDPEAGIVGFSHPTENMVMPLPYIEAYSGKQYDRAQKLWMERPDEDTWILTIDQHTYTYKLFSGEADDDIYRISHIKYSVGTNLTFYYQKQLLTRIVENSGRVLEMEHNDEGTAIKAVYYHYKNTNDLLVSYEYDERGNMIKVYDRAGKAIIFEYDDNNRVVKRTNRNGMAYFWAYDQEGRVIHTEGRDGIMSGSISYFPDEGFNEVYYRDGKTERYYYDENDLVYKKVDALGGETWYEHDRYNEEKMVSSPEGRVIGYEYDDRGNIITYHTADGEQYHYAYDDNNNLILRSDPAGSNETWLYNDQNQLLQHVQKDNRVIDFYYKEEQKLPVFCRDQDGNEVHWTYNSLNQLIESVTNEGNSSRWTYDDYGRLIRFSSGDDQTTLWERDEMGRVIMVKDFGGEALRFEYDAYDLPVYATDGHEEWHMAYTPMGSLKMQRRSNQVSKQNTQTLHFAYDQWENLKAITNEKGEEYIFLRDANDDVVKEIGFDGQEQQYIRNLDGQIIKTIQADGKAIYHNYDLSGRLVYSSYEDGTYEAFQYNKLGLLITAENELSSVNFKRNPLGLITQEIQDGYQINYQYDVFGNLISLNSSLGADIKYDYDEIGYLKGIAAKSGRSAQWAAAIAHNKNGQEISRSLSGGVKAAFSYDHEGHPISQKIEAGHAVTAFKQYTWGPNDKLNSCLNSITGGNINYRYDTFGSLSSASYSDDGKVIHKNPDEVGNLYKTTGRNDRRYDKGGKLLKDDQWYYRYDARGNLVQKSKRNIIGLAKEEVTDEEENGLFGKKLNWAMANPDLPKAETLDILADADPDLPEWKEGDWAYAWAATGMLKAIRNPHGELISFEYDALGRRKAKIIHGSSLKGSEGQGVIYRYVWDGNLLLHEWNYPLNERPNLVINEDGLLGYDKTEPLGDDLITWVYDQVKFTPSAKIVNGQYYSIISDYMGTPVQAYDDAGGKVWDCELDIYGKIRKLSGNREFVPFRYQGQYEDVETGLYYNRFRYYDPEQGNYISQDPIGLWGGNPSIYGYVFNSNYEVDVFGLKTFQQALGDYGEKWVKEALQNSNRYSRVFQVQNASGHGIDVVGMRHDGKFDIFEVKTNISGNVGNLSDRQLNSDFFIKNILEKDNITDFGLSRQQANSILNNIGDKRVVDVFVGRGAKGRFKVKSALVSDWDEVSRTQTAKGTCH